MENWFSGFQKGSKKTLEKTLVAWTVVLAQLMRSEQVKGMFLWQRGPDLRVTPKCVQIREEVYGWDGGNLGMFSRNFA